MSSKAFKYVFTLQDKMSSPLRKISTAGSTAYNKVIAAQKHYNSQVDRGNKKLNQMSSSAVNLGNMVRTYIGWRAVSGFFSLGSEMEQTRITFQSLLQDIEKGNSLFKNINLWANITPYTNNALLKGAKTLLSFQVAGDQIMPTLKMLGDVSTGSSERLRALTLAYAQMSAAGKLMGQDLLQFVNAGFNPLQSIAKKTGKTLMQLRDDMQRGLISSSMVTEAFKAATSEGGVFYKMTERIAKTMGGKWSTLVGKVTYKISELSESTSGMAVKVIDNLIKIGSWVWKNRNWIIGLITTVGSAVAAYYAWIGVTKLWALAMAMHKSIMFVVIGLTRGWAVAQRALNVAMMANPIGLIIAGVAALAVGVVYAWNKFGGFRSIVLGVWDVVKGFADMIKNYVVNRIYEFIKGVTSLGRVIELIFSGQFKEAAKVGATAMGNIFVGHESKMAAYKQGKNLGAAWSQGYAKGSGAKKISVPKIPGLSGSDSGFAGDTGMNALATSGLSTVNGINGGGKKNININTTIERLVENVNIHSANITEGASEMSDKVQEELLRALNGIVKMQGV